MFRCIYLVLVAVAIAAIILFFVSHKYRRHAIYILALVFSVAVTTWLLQVGTHQGPEAWRISVFLGSVLLTLGWIVTNEVAIQNSRRQHTINTIVQMIHSAQVIQDKQTIKASLPRHDSILTTDIVKFDDENNLLLQAVDRELNFLEFIAASIEAGDMDERLTRKCLRTVVLDAVYQYQPYITYWRSGKPTLWEHLVPYAASLK